MIRSIGPAVAFCRVSVDADGYNFTVIYGGYENGHFCCIPNHGIGCDMSSPTDVFYNTEALQRHGLSAEAAKTIATAIKKAVAKTRGDR